MYKTPVTFTKQIINSYVNNFLILKKIFNRIQELIKRITEYFKLKK